eukprot:1995420-Prymnesium_polylepis.2
MPRTHLAAGRQQHRRVRREPLPPAAVVDERALGRVEVDHVHGALAVGAGGAVNQRRVHARDRLVWHDDLAGAAERVRSVPRDVERLHLRHRDMRTA